MRPDRSDAHLPAEEEARIEEETRRYFQQMEPKRHPKPSRSDEDDLPNKNNNNYYYSDDQISIPELDKLRSLQSDAQLQIQKVVYEEGGDEDEFVETEYYKDLNSIDKQHHTTGTGFINISENERSSSSSGMSMSMSGGFDLNSAVIHQVQVPVPVPYRGNPATNDWIPSADLVMIPASNKPSRSDI